MPRMPEILKLVIEAQKFLATARNGVFQQYRPNYDIKFLLPKSDVAQPRVRPIGVICAYVAGSRLSEPDISGSACRGADFKIFCQ